VQTGAVDIDTPMRDLLGRLPGARRALFARYHLGGCRSCAFADDETLAELCTRNGFDAREVLAHLLESERHDEALLMDARRAWEARDVLRFVDLRTREEYEAVRIAGSEFFTQDLQQQLFAGPRQAPILLYDHMGAGVLDQVAWFRGHGLSGTYGLRGGIDAWSAEVDPAVKRYRLEPV
jgi:rhodanese-related sulfurtransferase